MVPLQIHMLKSEVPRPQNVALNWVWGLYRGDSNNMNAIWPVDPVQDVEWPSEKRRWDRVLREDLVRTGKVCKPEREASG